MKYRKLRIAWSVTWGVVAVLLCVLCLRSYWYHEVVWWTGSNNIASGATLRSGEAFVVRMQLEAGSSPLGWNYRNSGPTSAPFRGWMKWKTGASHRIFVFPSWLLCIPAIALGAFPWLPFRFSLRTLLIVTTLVAVVLGLVAWLRQ